jgi:glutathione synthase/RimK-type ligase-like ATP-grasp enzyme
MANHIVIVENKKDWKDSYPSIDVVTAREYLDKTGAVRGRNLRLINFCRSYKYLSTGYYCSLLSEARQQKIIPAVRTLTDLARKSIYSLNVEALDDQVNKFFNRQKSAITGDRLEIDVFFGETQSSELGDLARGVFEIFPCPLLRVEFRNQSRWQIHSIKPVHLSQIKAEQEAFFIEALTRFLGRRWRSISGPQTYKYDLAILYNENERLPPSNMRALKKFIAAGKKLGINVELIQRKEYNQLAEYDALFIRETTAINHHTYQFAKKAESEGMVVIDDPDSIVRCTNKVYLFELLNAQKIPVPKTRILASCDIDKTGFDLGYPMVLKIPDGSFSRGIHKAENEQQAREIAQQLLKESEIILAQEFMYTDYDWRIGVLNHKVIYACQYFMSKAHWQIIKHTSNGKSREGDHKTWPVSEVPDVILKTALDAVRYIGNGLYGVDIKQSGDKAYVIEVNDNPNIEAGVEDENVGDALYAEILSEFLDRLNQRVSDRNK